MHCILEAKRAINPLNTLHITSNERKGGILRFSGPKKMPGKSRGMQVGRSVFRGISASNLYVQPFSFGAAGEEVFHCCNKKSCRIRDGIDGALARNQEAPKCFKKSVKRLLR